MDTTPQSAILAAAAGLLGMTPDALRAALAKTATPPEPERLLTRRDAARILQVSLKTLQNWDRAGRLQPVKLGYRSLRYRQADLERLLAEATAKGQGGKAA